MSFMVDNEIRKSIEYEQTLKISPYTHHQINPNSYDLTLGNTGIVYTDTLNRHNPEPIIPIDPYDKDSIANMTRKHDFETLYVFPNDFMLLSTVETITLPDNIMGILYGKSSLARLGISVHTTAGFIDAGFSGTITLEITNSNPFPVKLYAGMRIAQIAFEKTEQCCRPYNVRKSSKYMYQEGPTNSKYYMNEHPITGINIRQNQEVIVNENNV